MTAEQDGLDPAKVQAEHPECNASPAYPEVKWCEGDHVSLTPWPCLPYRLATLALDLSKRANLMDAAYRTKWAAEDRADKAEALALDLQVKVTRFHEMTERRRAAGFPWISEEDAALADPTPAARCSQGSPLDRLTEPQCSLPEGHEGGHKFTSHDGRTDLEVMPK